jgi:iron complex outermembrane receptor protein
MTRGYIAALLGATCVATAAWGQAAPATDPTTAAPAPQSVAGGGLAEIVVTGQRRRENLQTVPIATVAINAANASAAGVIDTQSLVQIVPGLNFTRSGSASLPFLRGVGNPVAQPGDEPSVAYYVDDVYYPAGAASLSNFSNIDSIEVEKGPQGTLFGRNATGGVVQVFTKDPSSTTSADFSAGYANYNSWSGSMYVTGPVASNLSANLAMYGSKQFDGWGRNRCGELYASLGCTTDVATFRAYDYGARFKLKWTPGSNTTVLLTADYDKTYSEEGLNYHARGDTLTLVPTATGAIGVAPPSGFYDTVVDEPGHSIPQQGGVSLKVTQDMSWAKLVSISAWRHTTSIYNLDDDGGPTPYIDTHLGYRETTYTQELRLLSNESAPKWLTWIAGLYYMHDYAAAPYQFYGTAFGAAQTIDTKGVQKTDSYSGFVQATVEFQNDTHLTGGFRYTVDQRSFDAKVYYPTLGFGFQNFAADGSPLPTSKTFKRPSFRISLDHRFTPDIMAYIAFNRGFKSGVYNTTVTPSAGPINSPNFVQPETLDAYTAGVKTEFLDHKLRFNVEGFYYKFSDIQINENLAGLTVLSNAARATIKGVDIDMAARPIPDLTLNASVEYLHGRYTSFEDGVFFIYDPVVGGNTATSRDISGSKTIQTPPFSLTASADYLIHTGIGRFNLNVAFSHGGNYYFDPDNGKGQIDPTLDKQPTFNIINSSITWIMNDGKYDIRLWGKNLTGKQYYSYVSEQAFITEYSPAPPRTYGVTVQAHF